MHYCRSLYVPTNIELYTSLSPYLTQVYSIIIMLLNDFSIWLNLSIVINVLFKCISVKLVFLSWTYFGNSLLSISLHAIIMLNKNVTQRSILHSQTETMLHNNIAEILITTHVTPLTRPHSPWSKHLINSQHQNT